MKLKTLVAAVLVAAGFASQAAHAQASVSVQQTLSIASYRFIDLTPDDGVAAYGSLGNLALGDGVVGWTDGVSNMFAVGNSDSTSNGVRLALTYGADGRSMTASSSIDSSAALLFFNAQGGNLDFTVGAQSAIEITLSYSGTTSASQPGLAGNGIHAGGAVLTGSLDFWPEASLALGGVAWNYATPGTDDRTMTIFLSNSTDSDVSNTFALQLGGYLFPLSTSPVPEPDSLVLAGIAGAGALLARRRQRAKA